MNDNLAYLDLILGKDKVISTEDSNDDTNDQIGLETNTQDQKHENIPYKIMTSKYADSFDQELNEEKPKISFHCSNLDNTYRYSLLSQVNTKAKVEINQ